ncbi:MAG TPA: peptide deformylase [bacterium]|nr:peptide deformylase [bacterium]
MAILKVARLGNPVLLRPAEDIQPADVRGARIQRLIDDMIVTMRDERGVGLAAPQVHESLRLFVMDPGGSEEEGGGLRVVVNPVLSFPGDDVQELWEGCLSIPGIRGRTERHFRVAVESLDRQGNEQRFELEGFPAAVVQHETDHLDGILFFHRMPDLDALSFEEELARFRPDGGDEDEGDDESQGAAD